MVYDTIMDAARALVNGFNAIPTSLIEKLMLSCDDEVHEITPPCRFDSKPYGCLPAWGTVWTFGDDIDNEWLNGEYLGNHLLEMADCGFRIYEQEDLGYFFGIDGGGYNFFEEHWIPLYKARGLHWHKEDNECIQKSKST